MALASGESDCAPAVKILAPPVRSGFKSLSAPGIL